MIWFAGPTAEVNIMDEEVELVTMKSAIPVEPKHNNEKLNWNHKASYVTVCMLMCWAKKNKK